MFAIDLYDDSNPRKRRKFFKPRAKSEKVEAESVPDTSDIGYIVKLINEQLEKLNGKAYENWFSVKVTPTKPNCFRVIVFNKENRKVLINFFVEKGGNEEYVFTPPLDVKAFTTHSYENRNNFKSGKKAFV